MQIIFIYLLIHIKFIKIHIKQKLWSQKKTISHYQNKKTKMRFYFSSLLNILFTATYSCECFANTDFINTVLQWKDVPSELYKLESSSLSYHRYIFIFSAYYFLCVFQFLLHLPFQLSSKLYQQMLWSCPEQKTVMVHSKGEIAWYFSTKNDPRCMQTPQERLSICTEKKHLQISSLSYSKVSGSHDSSTGRIPEESLPWADPRPWNTDCISHFLTFWNSTAANLNNSITHSCNLAC